MNNVLIIGSTGQIGSELTMKLRAHCSGSVVAGYIAGAEPKGELLESGPAELVDITNSQQIADAVEKYHIDTIYTSQHCSLPWQKRSRCWRGRLALAD